MREFDEHLNRAKDVYASIGLKAGETYTQEQVREAARTYLTNQYQQGNPGSDREIDFSRSYFPLHSLFVDNQLYKDIYQLARDRGAKDPTPVSPDEFTYQDLLLNGDYYRVNPHIAWTQEDYDREYNRGKQFSKGLIRGLGQYNELGAFMRAKRPDF